MKAIVVLKGWWRTS
ncbi:TPA: trp operon leader peptide [Escherichia coli]|nr:trp operon leader peptide [Escherichia coli]